MIYVAGLHLEEAKVSLLQPDPSVPFQYLQTHQKRSLVEPEKELMLAVLVDAITCMQNYVLAKKNKEKRLFREAQEWIFVKDSDWPFSFENICFHLGIDPNYLRKGLMRPKKRAPSRSRRVGHGSAHEKMKAGRKRKPCKAAA
ncbi:MAG: hypothetical protein GTO40_12600 [Deltaproteobacteria bacterium]|nr:hypothetical protein [Deltaproteobacteria bacterium]